MATGQITRPHEIVKLINSNAERISSTTSGTLFTGCMYTLTYDKVNDLVNFVSRFMLQNVTQGARPVITITDNRFADCPSFIARGNSALRGNSGSAVASDECYAEHSAGDNTIVIRQQNFIGATPSGYCVYQAPGTST